MTKTSDTEWQNFALIIKSNTGESHQYEAIRNQYHMMTYDYFAKISIIMLLLEILEIQAHRFVLVYQVHPKEREKKRNTLKQEIFKWTLCFILPLKQMRTSHQYYALSLL